MGNFKIILATSFEKPWNNGWYYKSGFEKNGYEVIPYTQYQKGSFLEKVQSIKPDFILITKDEIDIEVLSECKKYTKLIQWYPDPVIPEWLIPYVKTVDLFFTMSEGLVEKFKKYNSNTFWLTQAFEPDFFKIKEITDNDIKKYSSDITFIGNLGSKPQYLPRRKALMKVLNERFNLKWWGPPLPKKIKTIPLIFGKLGRAYGGEFVYNETFAKVCKLSKIFLAFDSMPHIRKSMSARMYTAVGCGAFYMCQYVQGIEEVLIPDKEIVTFNDYDEMIDKIRFYLPKEDLRKKISKAGQERVLREHTYEVRIKQMIEIIKNVLF
ncbi:spore maturation protein CgeB [Thermodesulfovibrio aggregans]|uniref:Spore maturation protein CgeB n=1 Tax=Thermodesulfovibrio aggregans TaxID=86166 RepID=A0A0U9HV84_9BACT|nr:glycosyltransferase [Thermodesulfovibrio aggregans]GAQ94589.1 spore maturation protein CgeB [Thermodesulfovibrio aggregans]